MAICTYQANQCCAQIQVEKAHGAAHCEEGQVQSEVSLGHMKGVESGSPVIVGEASAVDGLNAGAGIALVTPDAAAEVPALVPLMMDHDSIMANSMLQR